MSATQIAAATTLPEDTVLPIPNLSLAQHKWTLQQANLSSTQHQDARTQLLAGIKADSMGPFLASLLPSSSPSTSTAAATSVLPANEELTKLLTELQEANKAELAKLDEKLKDAQENLGETEVADALKQKALYLAKIGEKDAAVEAYKKALEKVSGLSSKIDLQLGLIRVGFFHSDHALITESLTKTQELVDSGGDWDRRNRLKVYRGVHLLSIRQFKEGGQLLLDVLPTFTASELIKYEDFVGLCIIAGVLTLSRKDLKKKIIESPEVHACQPDLPHLKEYTTALYDCNYSKFFHALAEVETYHLQTSSLLAVHTRYYVKEMRIKAYAQMLESYRSVTLQSLSNSFGVSQDWLDADLARFIAQGRLNFTIDKVNGVVETSRPDAKNAAYEAVIKNSDALLNSIQRLSRVIG